MKFRRCVLFVAAFLMLAGPVGAATAGGGAGAAPDPFQVDGLQQRMLNDPGIMALIMALMNDPEMQALLADPKVQEAIQNGDVGALLNDPRFRKLLDNPQVKEIEKRLDAPDGGEER